MLTWLAERNASCPGCGLPRDETMDKDNDGAYVATPLQCHACAARERAATKFTSQTSDTKGLMFMVEKRD